jgi:hypothetical protein
MCPACQSLKREWEVMSGHGTIWSFVVPHPPLLPAYAELAPYNAIIVSLDEDPSLRFVGNLVTSADSPINEIDPCGLSPARGRAPTALGARWELSPFCSCSRAFRPER